MVSNYICIEKDYYTWPLRFPIIGTERKRKGGEKAMLIKKIESQLNSLTQRKAKTINENIRRRSLTTSTTMYDRYHINPLWKKIKEMMQ